MLLLVSKRKALFVMGAVVVVVVKKNAGDVVIGLNPNSSFGDIFFLLLVVFATLSFVLAGILASGAVYDNVDSVVGIVVEVNRRLGPSPRGRIGGTAVVKIRDSLLRCFLKCFR